MKIAILFANKSYDEIWRKELSFLPNKLAFPSKDDIVSLIHQEGIKMDADCVLLEDEVVNAVLSSRYDNNLYVVDTEFNDGLVFTPAELIERGLYIDYVKKYDKNYSEGEISFSLKNNDYSISVSLNFGYNDSFYATDKVSYDGISYDVINMTKKNPLLYLIGDFCRNMAKRWHTVLILKEECQRLRLKRNKEDIEKMILKLKDYPELDDEKKRLQFTIS